MDRPTTTVTITSATVVRVLLVSTATGAALAVLWLLRGPLVWVLIAALIATAISRPIDALSKRMPRAIAIATVYVTLVLVPVGLLLLAVPPLVGEAQHLIESLPKLIQDLQTALQKNGQLRSILSDFDPLTALKEESATIPSKLGDVAGLIGAIGLGALNSIVAAITILILSVFFVSTGGKSIQTAIDLYGGDRRPLLHRLTERASRAIAAYFAGTLLIAVVAGITSYVVMTILGIPYAVALAVICGISSLIPMFGATIAAVFVGIIAALTSSWTVVLAWSIWEIIYQQIENNLVQPQIQKRTVKVPPVATVVGVLFGSALLGVLGAVIAIPAIAAAIAIVEELSAWKRGAAAATDGAAFDQATRARAGVHAVRDGEQRRDPAARLAAREQSAESDDASAEQEACRRGRASELGWATAHVPAPVRGLAHPDREIADGAGELVAMGLDRGPDLIGRALRAHAFFLACETAC